MSAEFIDEFYELAITQQVPWQWGTLEETPEAFRHSLTNDVLINFMIADRRDGRGVGYLSAYGANYHHRYCYVTLMLHPAYRLRAWPLEGLILFGNLLFIKYEMRNLYMQTAGPYLTQFRSGIGRSFEVEGHFHNRLLLNGKPQDLYVLTVSRDRWFETGVAAVERCTRPLRKPGTEVVGTAAASLG